MGFQRRAPVQHSPIRGPIITLAVLILGYREPYRHVPELLPCLRRNTAPRAASTTASAAWATA